MSDKVDYAIQDCEQLELTVSSNLAAMKKKGFTDEKKSELTSAKELLVQKNTAQITAVKLVGTKTAEQNTAIAAVSKIVQKVRDAAKTAFDADDPKLKLFKVGEQMPTAVKRLRSLCEYLGPVVVDYTAVLLQNGLEQADIDAFHSAYGTLVAVDASQENAKKLQTSATIERDAQLAKLNKVMSKVRSFAATCFSGSPEILVQFKPIPKGRGGGGGGGEDTPPEPPQSPDQPK